MDEWEGPEDPTLAQVEAFCNLADLYDRISHKDIRSRVLKAMDAVLTKLGPPGGRVGSLIDVTGRH